MQNKLISFLIAAYNEEKFITECIDSCLNQTYENIEVVVVDDGSTDRTAEIVRGYSHDSRVKFLRFESNRGKVHAFNSAYDLSSGEYLCLVGADDVNYLDRIERSLNCLTTENVDLVAGDLEVCNERLEKIGVIHVASDWGLYDLMISNRIPGPTPFFTRKLGDAVFPIPSNLRFEDWWVAFIVALDYRWKAIGEVVVRYRQHDSNDVGVLGSTKLRRMKDFPRHLAYYDAFDEYLEKRSSPELEGLRAHIRACRALKLMYLERKFFARFKFAVEGGAPRGARWKAPFFATLLFGAAGYEAAVVVGSRLRRG